MELLQTLQNYGVINVGIVILIVGIMTVSRKNFLDSFLDKNIKETKGLTIAVQKWLILTGISFLVSVGLSLLMVLGKFETIAWLWEWIKSSFINLFASWIAHDTIKNMFFKEQQ